ncbi:MAG: AMP-binding protein [Spirochaetes bacterium]|nr:AMP-binding protein [Spirochaetota bacterium]MBU0953907.1 AMP-binding protein [Spirochaetota bacterium]
MYRLISYTLRSLLLQSAKRYGNRPALAFLERQPVSYLNMAKAAAKLAQKLAASGISPGDKVALISENRPEWPTAYFGITAGGRVAVPILVDFTAEQIENIVTHAECKAVILSEKLRVKLDGHKLPDLIAIESMFDGIDLNSCKENDCLAEIETVLPPVPEDSLAVIIYTSGTTGHSKGVMLSHMNLVWNAWATRSIIHLRRNDRFLSMLPLAHTYECTIGMIAPLMQGSFISYMDKPPSASVLLPALKILRPSVMVTVPIIIEKIFRASVRPKLEAMKAYKQHWLRPLLHRLAGLKLKKTFGGKLRFYGVGGAGLSPDVEQFLIDARFPYAIGYGLTETAPLLAGCAPHHTALGSTGPALRSVTLRIADPDPKTGDGEIQAKGKNVMLGYYKNEEATKEVFTEDGWFKTGDLGHFDHKNRLYIRGRLKALILGATGENIYPEEIESLLNANEHVAESLVYNDEDGLHALVNLKPEIMEKLGAAVQDRLEDAEDMLESIRKAVNSKLSSFSRLAKVKLHIEPFEKTPSQKIKRFLYQKKQ